jgi:glycosyltransferase involved in cell wall biosynthesis
MSDVKESYFSLNILKKPEGLNKGAVILSQVDEVVSELPWIKDIFYIIERRGWRGLNSSKHAHIKLVEDLSLWNQTLELFPKSICLDIGPADFVDTESFKPLGIAKDYDGIQVSHWSDFKRSDMIIRAAGILPQRNFLKLGHFVDGGSEQEYRLRDSNIRLAGEVGANIYFPYAEATNNDSFPDSKEVMNAYINRARIGILTTKVEGINRFKMECLAAGVPVLVPADVSYPTKKHITDETGALFEPTPEGLARTIEDVITHIHRYCPRAYIERTTGKPIALNKLRNALLELCKRDGREYVFNSIDWDGRNQSLTWGKNVFNELRRYKSSL